MKNNSLKFLLPLLITSFIGLITFIYLSGRAESKESVSDAKETAVLANEKADESLKRVAEIEGDLRVLDEKVTGQVNNINTNIDWIKRAMIDNGIKPR